MWGRVCFSRGTPPEKWISKYTFGFGLGSGVVKVFLVNSLYLARKSTRNNAPWWRNGISNWSRDLSSRRKTCTVTCTLSPRRSHVINLRSYFVIRVRCFWSIFSLRKENWPKSPNSNICVKFIFPWSSTLIIIYYYYYYLGIPQQRESFSLIEGVSTDRYKSVEAQLLCMWDGAI